MQRANSLVVCLMSLGCILLSGCSRTSWDDDLARARQYSTISELEEWLGEPTAIEPLHDLEKRELPDGVTFTDTDGNSLGHGEYPVIVPSAREVRQYEHPNKTDVRFLVSVEDGRIKGVDMIGRVKMLDEPSDAPKSRSQED